MEVDRKRKRERDYRDILCVDEFADEDAIKKAYYRLAKEFHPDRPNNKGKKEESERMFAKVTEAYEALLSSTSTMNLLKSSFKCTKTSNALEQFLSSTGKLGSFSPMRAEEFSQSTGNFSSVGGGSTHNLNGSTFSLESMVGSSLLNQLGAKFNTNIITPNSPRPPPRRGQSLQTTLRVGFKEALYGCSKTIEFSRSLLCPQCHGAGTCVSKFASNSSSLSGSPTQSGNCRDCNGKGMLSAKINTAGMNLSASVSTTCTTCNGSGSNGDGTASMNTSISINSTSMSGTSSMLGNGSGISNRGLGCSNCGGLGKMSSRKTCTVNVPAGVLPGSQQVFENEGDEGVEGGAPGDLIICFEVENHAFYQRSGDDVCCKISIPLPHLLLGTRIEVVSLYGKTIPVDVPGIISLQSSNGEKPKHQIIKVTNEGFICRGNAEGETKRGHMYLQIGGEMPQNLNQEERNIMSKLATTEHFTKPLLFGDTSK